MNNEERRIVNLKWKWHCARDRFIPCLNSREFIDFFVASVRYSIGCSRLKRRHDKLRAYDSYVDVIFAIELCDSTNSENPRTRFCPRRVIHRLFDIYTSNYITILANCIDRINSEKERKIKRYVSAASALKFNGRLDAFGFHILISNKATCRIYIFHEI